MATLKQLARRIRSAKNIQQITRAMKLVAAARLRRAQDRVIEGRPYAEKMRELMASLAEAGEMPPHPLLQRRPIQKYGVLLFTAERGLCGSFNTNLNRRSAEYIKATPGEAKIIAVGKKGYQFFARRKYDIPHRFTIPASGPTLVHAREITQAATKMFESGEVDAVQLVYSRFYSAIRQIPETVRLLPIEPPKTDFVAHERPENGKPKTETVASGQSGRFTATYTFEPDAAALLGQLLPRYALALVLQALFESTASEHGARMTAMSSATDNAGEMIQQLTLQANRSRQAAITKEILEVVSGAEALRG